MKGGVVYEKVQLLEGELNFQCLQVSFDQVGIDRAFGVDHIHLQVLQDHTPKDIEPLVPGVAGEILVFPLANQTLRWTAVVLKPGLVEEADRLIGRKLGAKRAVLLDKGALGLGIRFAWTPFRFFET